MAAIPEVIYCGGGNRRFCEMAIAAGMKYGARLPGTIYGDLYFADQNYHKPDRVAYMRGLARHKPAMATVLDLESEDQLGLVLDWAEEAAQHVERVLIIPKVHGIIGRLPRRVGGADVILGYSVPTKYGGTFVSLQEFEGWPVHLLGGSPHAQIVLSGYNLLPYTKSSKYSCPRMSGVTSFYPGQVMSVDGNMINKMATRHGQFWVAGGALYAANRFWPTLVEADGERWGHDVPYEAFRRSVGSIMTEWNRLAQNSV